MRFLRREELSPACQKVGYPRILAMREQLPRRSAGDLAVRCCVEEYASVADGEDAGELVRHHDHRRSEAGAQIEDQLVETARGDRVQAGRRLVEKKE